MLESERGKRDIAKRSRATVWDEEVAELVEAIQAVGSNPIILLWDSRTGIMAVCQASKRRLSG